MRSIVIRLSVRPVLFALAAGFILFGAVGQCHAQENPQKDESSIGAKTPDTVSALASDNTTQPSAVEALPDPPSPSPSPAGAAADQGNWHLAIAPYLWIVGAHGTIGGPNEQLGFSASPSDLFSHFRFGLMGLVDLRYKRVLFPLDIIWARLGDDKATDFIPTPTVANLRVHLFVLTQKVGYRLIDSKMVKVDAMAGFRYWHIYQGVSFTTTSLNFSNSQNWVDPVVGGRITANLSPKFQVVIAGDDGGWGTGSQQDYQIFGGIGYRFKPKLALDLGYRYMYTNYINGDRFLDLTLSGALIGVTIDLK